MSASSHLIWYGPKQNGIAHKVWTRALACFSSWVELVQQPIREYITWGMACLYGWDLGQPWIKHRTDISLPYITFMDLLPDMSNRGCACAGNAGNVFPATAVSDLDMHHGTCVTHVPWCMPKSLTGGFLWSRRRGENVPGIPGACASRNVTYLARGPWTS